MTIQEIVQQLEEGVITFTEFTMWLQLHRWDIQTIETMQGKNALLLHLIRPVEGQDEEMGIPAVETKKLQVTCVTFA